ncbi:MAG: translation initiation factor 2, partial [Eggerthella lenta]|nr:translation initiation factor 2 [Eggerthella lenta]
SQPQPRQTRGAHARPNRAVEIRVIPGGLLREEPHPAHAKASPLDGMRGIGFDLAGKERAVAATFGILFALAALAATIYS